jgi:alpha-tubulin suppressor-like RCC1 family protein
VLFFFLGTASSKILLQRIINITMTSILVANLLLFLSSCGDVTAAAARTHQSKGIRPLRRQLQSNNDNELDLPAEDSTKTWLFGAGDSSEWGAVTTTNDANDSTVETNHHRPTLINISALGQGEFVTDTSAGTLHSTVVTNQGRILTASSVAIQTSGIGRDTLDGTQLDFQPIRQVYYLKEDNTHDQNPSTPPTFSKVVASQYYTLALDTAGNVWSTGVNTYGQLCLGDTTARDRFYQVAITIAEEEASTTTTTKVVDIALGERHTLLLMENGKVFGCGWNAYGQLGIGMKGENMLTPVEILIDEPDFDNNTNDTPPPMVANITQIAAGRGSSYFLTSSNHVYATGTNYEGQLCLGDRVDRPLPTMLVPLEEMLLSQGKNNDFSLHDEGVVVHLIAAGKSSFYMLLTNGQVVACGKNTHGQLGNDNSDSTAAASDVPAVVTALTNVTDIFATAISFTAFFLQNNGIYGVGQDGSGQLGNGAMQWQWDPAVSEVSCPGGEERASIGQQNIIISSGNDHTLFLVNADAIFDCEGNNNPLEPTSSMSPFASVAPTPTAPPQTYYPTTPSPQVGSTLFPTLSQPPTMSPVNPDRNQPSGGVKLNGMGVFCSGIAFATWQLLM